MSATPLPDLVLSTGTAGNPPLPSLVDAAVAGGYAGIACWPHDYRAWREAGVPDPEARARCADAGAPLVQLDGLIVWWRGDARATAEEDEVFTAAAGLGVPCVAAIGPATAVEEDLLAERFAGVCARAGERGLAVALELSPWKGTLDLPAGERLVTATGAGLVLDSWHLGRAHVPPTEVAALPAVAIRAVQLSDAPAAAEADLVEETMRHRLLPGEGTLDLTGYLRAVAATGARPAVTVEVLSDALVATGPSAAARTAAEASRAVLAAAYRTA